MPNTTSVLQKVYRLISLRQRSEKEIRDYCSRKSYSDLVIEETVKKLKELRLLDDEQFAKAWIESRSRKKGMRVIRQELLQKGISKEIIDELTSNMLQDINEEETAAKLLEKKINSWKNLEPLKFKKKAYEFLMRRGFEYDIVKGIVEKYLKKDYN